MTQFLTFSWFFLFFSCVLVFFHSFISDLTCRYLCLAMWERGVKQETLQVHMWGRVGRRKLQHKDVRARVRSRGDLWQGQVSYKKRQTHSPTYPPTVPTYPHTKETSCFIDFLLFNCRERKVVFRCWFDINKWGKKPRKNYFGAWLWWLLLRTLLIVRIFHNRLTAKF